MKKLILITLALIHSLVTTAKCGNRGIYLFYCMPNGISLSSEATLIEQDPVIILEFYGFSQTLVQNLNKKHPVYLRSGKLKILLIPTEVLVGEFSITQVIFRPAARLKIGSSYDLVIDSLPKYEMVPSRYSVKTQKSEPISFNIIPGKDNAPGFPVFPVEIKKTRIRYGCGPAEWVYFSLGCLEGTFSFVKASVRNLTTGKITTYILPVKDGVVGIGHGMCSGAFHFDGSLNFEVTFALFNRAGISGPVSSPIIFERPMKDTGA